LKNENEFLDFFKHLLNFAAYFLVHQLQNKEVTCPDINTGLEINYHRAFIDFVPSGTLQ